MGTFACNGVEVLPFPAGQGQKKVAPVYPSGPFGVSKGSVITNDAFVGFYAPQTNADANALQPVSLADFYNPSGNGVYPAGSPYGPGAPMPKALLIDIGATWCGPCQQEAHFTLPAEYKKLHPGAEFLFVLADGADTGVPATPAELTTWVNAFKTVYPSVIDPERKLGSAFNASAYPVNILIDTRTMVIVDVLGGAPEQGGAFFDEIAATIAK